MRTAWQLRACIVEMSLKEKRLVSGRQRVAREILYYLMEHPDAKDTMKGILKWWMPKGYLERGAKEVQMALDDLVMQGWLTTWAKDFQKDKIYGVNKAGLKEIKAFLGELEGEKKIKN